MRIYDNGIYRDCTEEEVSGFQLSLEAQNEMKIAELQANLQNGETDFMKALEQWASQNASGELKQIAEQRIAVRATIDSIGKVVQSKQGDGTAFNPFKTWSAGVSVNEGEWWQTYDGYLWQAIKSGIPTSSTDKEYWDVID